MISLITGITGMDGSHLAEHLLEKGEEVVGLTRRTSLPNTTRISHFLDKIVLEEADILDQQSLNRLISDYKPDKVFHLAAQSHVGTSFKVPNLTFNTTANGTLNMLEAIKENSPASRFYFAGSSEQFGSNYFVDKDGLPYQNEQTPMQGNSPYGIAKIAGYQLTQLYRSYNLFACSGILFNHEGPRRGESFVTRKITKWIGSNYEDIIRGKYPRLYLGNLKAKRDWGPAKEYVKAMNLMLEQGEPDDYVIATGETHSIEEFLEVAFGYLGLNWEDYVEIDPKFFRPCEVPYLRGDPTKAKENLSWKLETSFEELVREMLESDLQLSPNEIALSNLGPYSLA